ncbi:VOC family protein [Candidatus Poriferisocius sp.]|uniref:VOC family protein n=1 Tax=Candidatus Poriferisocius sp. TaxID=3101276 RepID=UPI003B02C060
MPEVDGYAHGDFSWVDLCTEEPDKAKAFYSSLFGLTFRDEHDGSQVVYTLGLKDERPVLGLLEKPQEMCEMGIPNVWETYISVDNADEALAKVAPAGGTPMGPVMEPAGAGRMVVVADPTGAVVMLWEAIGQDGAELKSEHGTLCWNQLLTSDVDKALAFYSEMLGWTPIPLDMDDSVGIMHNGEMIASAGPLPAPLIPAHWAVYFAVDDCDATAAQCQELGGHVVVPPMDTPPGRMAQLVDDAGAMFWVITLNPDFSMD